MQQYSIRGMLTVTMICGLGFGWWIDHRRLTKRVDDVEVRCMQEIGKTLHWYQFRDQLKEAGLLDATGRLVKMPNGRSVEFPNHPTKPLDE